MLNQKDVVIIGGGFVGLTAGLIMSRLGLSVLLLDANAAHTQAQNDGRAIALAYTSVVLMKNLGLSPYLDPYLNPIDEVITSEEGHFNKLRIRAADLSLPYLGQVCPAPMLGRGLLSACEQDPLLDIIHEAVVTQVNPDTRTLDYVKNNSVTTLKATLILCCDGADSALAKTLAFESTVKSYEQMAWVANISCSVPHHNTAIERFTQWGTLALLPLRDQRMTVVLSLDKDKVQPWAMLTNDQKIEILQSLIGSRFGMISDLGKTFEYPLKETVLNKTYQAGLLFLGNAVHTINPIAAQGLNLSFRDLSVLSDVLKETLALSQDIGSPECLSCYESRVKPAHQSMLRLTDFLVFVSKHKFKYARSLALGLLNTTMAKGMLAKTLAGLSSHRGSLMDVSHDL